MKPPLRNRLLTPVVYFLLWLGKFMPEGRVYRWWERSVIVPVDSLLIDLWKDQRV